MNEDQAKGKMKDIAGKVQEKVGDLTGSTEQKVKGMGKQVGGKAQEGMGDLKNAADNVGRDKDK